MLNTKKSLAFLMACLLLFVNCNRGAKVIAKEAERPLNIILLIGDGMGLAQISAASFIYGGLTLDQLTDLGFIKTSSANDYITDSAAGATAFSTGEKSYNGAIGVGMDTMPLISILELAEKNGLSSGLISTCSITHATPASFFAHQANREMHQEIAQDFYNKNIDFVASTGKPYFDLNKLIQNGYAIQTGKSSGNMDALKKQFWFYNDSIHPPKANERGAWLNDATRLGIKHLANNKKGFFLMVEGSQIDWGGHDTDFNYTISELRDFDLAIKTAIDFAKKDGHTLVIVTADHETGGLTLDAGTLSPRSIQHHYASAHHSGIMVPIYAFGPGASLFRGTHENTDVFKFMKLLFNFK
ncbi:MAG: alkaline phosphatase [Bacteroidia bacterium]|nr:alkaline phosphatase [Bacteroidia bacterium]